MIVVVRNIEKKDDDLKARVLETMKKQIKKKFLGQRDEYLLSIRCDAPFNNNNSIQQ